MTYKMKSLTRPHTYTVCLSAILYLTYPLATVPDYLHTSESMYLPIYLFYLILSYSHVHPRIIHLSIQSTVISPFHL